MKKEIAKIKTKKVTGQEIPVFSLETGKKIKTISVPEFLQIKVSPALVHQVLVAQESKSLVSSHAKTRSEVRGGGRKPFRQKGTGRARAGSIKSPLWRGGGVIFGPSKFENKTKNISKKMKKRAILGLLAEKIDSKKAIVVDSLDLKKSKTKEAYLKLFVFVPKAKSLLILATAEIDKIKPFRNIKNLKYTKVENLDLRNLILAQNIIFSQEGFSQLIKINNNIKK